MIVPALIRTLASIWIAKSLRASIDTLTLMFNLVYNRQRHAPKPNKEQTKPAKTNMNATQTIASPYPPHRFAIKTVAWTLIVAMLNLTIAPQVEALQRAAERADNPLALLGIPLGALACTKPGCGAGGGGAGGGGRKYV